MFMFLKIVSIFVKQLCVLEFVEQRWIVQIVQQSKCTPTMADHMRAFNTGWIIGMMVYYLSDMMWGYLWPCVVIV